MAESEGGGIRRVIRLVVDKASLRSVIDVVKATGTQAGRELGESMSQGVSIAGQAFDHLRQRVKGATAAQAELGQSAENTAIAAVRAARQIAVANAGLRREAVEEAAANVKRAQHAVDVARGRLAALQREKLAIDGTKKSFADYARMEQNRFISTSLSAKKMYDQFIEGNQTVARAATASAQVFALESHLKKLQEVKAAERELTVAIEYGNDKNIAKHEAIVKNLKMELDWYHKIDTAAHDKFLTENKRDPISTSGTLGLQQRLKATREISAELAIQNQKYVKWTDDLTALAAREDALITAQQLYTKAVSESIAADKTYTQVLRDRQALGADLSQMETEAFREADQDIEKHIRQRLQAAQVSEKQHKQEIRNLQDQALAWGKVREALGKWATEKGIALRRGATATEQLDIMQESPELEGLRTRGRTARAWLTDLQAGQEIQGRMAFHQKALETALLGGQQKRVLAEERELAILKAREKAYAELLLAHTEYLKANNIPLKNTDNLNERLDTQRAVIKEIEKTNRQYNDLARQITEIAKLEDKIREARARGNDNAKEIVALTKQHAIAQQNLEASTAAVVKAEVEIARAANEVAEAQKVATEQAAEQARLAQGSLTPQLSVLERIKTAWFGVQAAVKGVRASELMRLQNEQADTAVRLRELKDQKKKYEEMTQAYLTWAKSRGVSIDQGSGKSILEQHKSQASIAKDRGLEEAQAWLRHIALGEQLNGKLAAAEQKLARIRVEADEMVKSGTLKRSEDDARINKQKEVLAGIRQELELQRQLNDEHDEYLRARRQDPGEIPHNDDMPLGDPDSKGKQAKGVRRNMQERIIQMLQSDAAVVAEKTRQLEEIEKHAAELTQTEQKLAVVTAQVTEKTKAQTVSFGKLNTAADKLKEGLVNGPAGRAVVTAWDAVGASISKTTAFLRTWTTLNTKPTSLPADMSDVTKEMEARAAKNVGQSAVSKAGRTDDQTARFNRELKALRLEAQLGNITFTKLGAVLKTFGVDTRKTGSEFQRLAREIRNTRKGVDELDRAAHKVSDTLGGKFRKILTSVAGQLGIAFSVHQVVRWGKAAIHAAQESQDYWARLNITLADFGKQLTGPAMDKELNKLVTVTDVVSKKIQANLDLGVTSKDTLSTIGTLIQLSGDWEKSIESVTLVTDAQVAMHWTHEQATRAVGRAIAGDLELFTRRGIILDKTKDSMVQLNQRMGQEAAAVANTFGGAVRRVKAHLNELNIAIGNSFDQASGAKRTSDQLVDTIKAATQWVLHNQRTFSQIGAVIMQVLNGIANLGKIIATIFLDLQAILIAVMGSMYGAFLQSKILITRGYREILTLQAAIERGMNKLKGTTNDFYQNLLEEQRTTVKLAEDEFTVFTDRLSDQMNNLWGNFSDEMQNFKIPPAFEIKHPAGKIEAKADLKLNREIEQLGRIVRHGDEDARADAIDRVNDLLRDQQELLAKIQEKDAKMKENLANIMPTEEPGAFQGYYVKQLEVIEGVIANLNRISGQAQKINERASRAANREVREIERIGRIARRADKEAQEGALVSLAEIEGRLKSRQSMVKKYSLDWFAIEDNLNKIQQIRVDRLEDQDNIADKLISRHKKLLELNINEVGSMGELLEVQKANNLAIAEAVRLKNVDREATLRLRAVAIADALQTKHAARGQRIDTLSAEITEPTQRVEAEKELLRISRELNKEIDEQQGLQRDVTHLVLQRAKVEQILKDNHHMSIADINRQIVLGGKLARDASTRKDAEEVYQKMQEEITNQLKTRIDLTKAERDELEAILKLLGVRIAKIDSPVTDLVQDWKNAWKEMGESFKENVAEKMADSWMAASTLMFRDIHNLKKATTTMFQGMGKALASELRNIAMMRVKEHLAEAIGDAAFGFKMLANPMTAPLAAFYFKAAAGHVAAAAAWAALGGVAGALGGKGVDPAQSGSQTDKNTGKSADDAKQGPIIYLRIDGMDPGNPRHQQLAGQAVQNWQETTGGQLFTVGGK